MGFTVLLEKMVVFVALMVIGYGLSRSGYLSRAFITDASKLTLNVFMVATIINVIAASDIGFSFGELMGIIAVMSAMIVICYAIGGIAARLIPMPDERRPAFALLLSVMNNVFVGMPVVNAAYGTEAVFYVSMSNVAFNSLLYSYGVYRLTGGSGEKFTIKRVLTPPLVSTLVAVILFVTHVRMPGIAKTLLDTMSAATMPLSMLAVGASLGSVSLVDAFRDKSAYVIALLSLVVTPAMVWLALAPFVTNAILLKTAVVCAGCPSGIVVTVLSVQYGKDYVFSSKAILLSTMLSMATLPALVYILG